MKGARLALLSDVGGPLACVALQIDSYLLKSDQEPRRRAYEHLIGSFAPETRLLIVMDAAEIPRGARWIEALRLSGPVRLVPAPAHALRGQGAWMRDAFLNACAGADRMLLGTHTQRPAGQGRWLAAAAGARFEPREVSLEGGDCLIGDDFWIVGVQALRNSMLISGRRCGGREALRRLVSLDSRLMHVAGYPREGVSVDAGAGESVEECELAQDWAHIDLVVSLTGARNAAGAPVLLIASPTAAPCHPDAAAAYAAAPLDAMARRFERQGFAVLRNPAPFAGNPRRLAPYCNVILQREPDIVWLPQFADAGEAFAASDAANVALWEGLGYRVIPVGGWGAFLGAKGAIRCATNVIAREPLALQIDEGRPAKRAA